MLPQLNLGSSQLLFCKAPWELECESNFKIWVTFKTCRIGKATNIPQYEVLLSDQANQYKFDGEFAKLYKYLFNIKRKW